MKKISALIFLSIVLCSCKSSEQRAIDDKQQINQTLNTWHKAASEAHFDEYFSLMTKDGVFVGTDATENWQNKAFRDFAKPYFDKGKGWTYVSMERNIYLNKSQNTAWFDELLESKLKICRGSGVLVKEQGKWKIAHYVLSMTIPNDKASEAVKLKTAEEDEIIRKLKNK